MGLTTGLVQLVVPFLLVHHAGPARNADEGANDLERNGSARDHRRAGRPRGGRWQVRVALATRGRKQSAAVLGAVNAVPSAVALGQVRGASRQDARES